MPVSITRPMRSIADGLKNLRESLNAHPYVGGVHPVTADALGLYYDVLGDKHPRYIHLGANATEEDLAELTAACQVEDMGEGHGKVGEMDRNNAASRKFSPFLDVAASGLLESITPYILDGNNAEGNQVLKAEISKLNVYGPGSLLTTHKETPRREITIGSLVVIFPTAHTGGGLTLEHGDTAWTFDAAATHLSTGTTPALAYVAFHNDVKHAIGPVHKGHCVTLTYNLFLPAWHAGAGPANHLMPIPECTFETTLQTLLADPAFLPAGGFLAYGLAHAYPRPTTAARIGWNLETHAKIIPPSRLAAVLASLKGTDARIRTIAKNAGLEVQVKLLYNTDYHYSIRGHDVLVDDLVDVLGAYEFDFMKNGATAAEMVRDAGVILQREGERLEELTTQWIQHREQSLRSGNRPEEIFGDGEEEPGVPVHWVTRLLDSEHNRVASAYISGDTMVEYMYGHAGLFVRVPALGDGVRGPGMAT